MPAGLATHPTDSLADCLFATGVVTAVRRASLTCIRKKREMAEWAGDSNDSACVRHSASGCGLLRPGSTSSPYHARRAVGGSLLAWPLLGSTLGLGLASVSPRNRRCVLGRASYGATSCARRECGQRASMRGRSGALRGPRLVRCVSGGSCIVSE
jgi:hypothetical protein